MCGGSSPLGGTKEYGPELKYALAHVQSRPKGLGVQGTTLMPGQPVYLVSPHARLPIVSE